MKALVKLTLIGLTTLGLSLSAMAGQWVSQSFINGQWLAIPAGQTNQYGDTNVFYVDRGNMGRWSQSTNYTVPTTGTGGSNFTQSPGFPALYWTNGATFYSTNAQAGGANTGAIWNPPATVDVSGFVDANGNAPSSAVFSVFMPATNNSDYPVTSFTGPTVDRRAIATNWTYFTLTKIPMDDTSIGGFGENPQFPKFTFGSPPPMTPLLLQYDYIQFAVTNNAGYGFRFVTNIPSNFMQGARKIRLTIGATSGNSILTNYYRDISLTGWVN